MKCWKSAFNAQGSRLIIIVALQVGAVKIYEERVEALTFIVLETFIIMFYYIVSLGYNMW
jgi:hypothetical membrane protein